MSPIEKIKYWIRDTNPQNQIERCKEVLFKIYNPFYFRNNEIDATDLNKPFHLLIDTRTDRVVLATHNAEIVRTLSRCPNSYYFYNLTIGNYPGCKVWELDPTFDCTFPWNSVALGVQFFDNKCISSNDVLTPEQIYDFYLLYSKGKLLNIILSVLESMKLECNVNTSIYQTSIYQEKYNQAIKVIEGNVESDKQNLYYYVNDWAAVRNISLLSAAKDIKINYELTHQRLSKIEYARLLFTDKIRNETDINNLDKILSDFRMFNFGYLKL